MANEFAGKQSIDRFAAALGKELGKDIKAEYSKDKDGHDVCSLKIEKDGRTYEASTRITSDAATGKPSSGKYAALIAETNGRMNPDEMARYMEQLHKLGGKAAVNEFLKDVSEKVDKSGSKVRFESAWTKDGKSVDLIMREGRFRLIMPVKVVDRTAP